MSERLLFSLHLGDVEANVIDRPEIGVVLQWLDGINEWGELFGSLPVALCRLAALVECGATDWVSGFRHGQQKFEEEALTFLASVLG